MKKLIFPMLLFLLAPAFFSSCKKQSKNAVLPNSAYYVKFNFNGTQKQYSYYTTSLLGAASTPDGCEIIGYNSGTKPAGVTIAIVDNQPITINKTYTQAIGDFTYVDEAGVAYFASSVAAGTSLNLNIAQIATNYIKGTFSGVLQKEGSPVVYFTVTNGQFYLGRSQ
jgi:hypothetical protein